jgi:putative endonuclease
VRYFDPVAQLDTCRQAGSNSLMKYYVYAMISIVDGRVYVGLTNDVSRRLKEHNQGKTRSTRFYRPWELFYTDVVDNLNSARCLELKLKSGSGKEFLKKQLSICPRSSVG